MKKQLAIDLTSYGAGVQVPAPDHQFWKGVTTIPEGLETKPEQMALKLAIVEARIAKLEREKWLMKMKTLWQTWQNWRQKRRQRKTMRLL